MGEVYWIGKIGWRGWIHAVTFSKVNFWNRFETIETRRHAQNLLFEGKPLKKYLIGLFRKKERITCRKDFKILNFT